MDNTLVPVRIGFRDTALRDQAKSAQGKWDPEAKAWCIEYGKIKGIELEKFVILETRVNKIKGSYTVKLDIAQDAEEEIIHVRVTVPSEYKEQIKVAIDIANSFILVGPTRFFSKVD